MNRRTIFLNSMKNSSSQTFEFSTNICSIEAPDSFPLTLEQLALFCQDIKQFSMFPVQICQYLYNHILVMNFSDCIIEQLFLSTLLSVMNSTPNLDFIECTSFPVLLKQFSQFDNHYLFYKLISLLVKRNHNFYNFIVNDKYYESLCATTNVSTTALSQFEGVLELMSALLAKESVDKDVVVYVFNYISVLLENRPNVFLAAQTYQHYLSIISVLCTITPLLDAKLVNRIVFKFIQNNQHLEHITPQLKKLLTQSVLWLESEQIKDYITTDAVKNLLYNLSSKLLREQEVRDFVDLISRNAAKFEEEFIQEVCLNLRNYTNIVPMLEFFNWLEAEQSIIIKANV